jgi:hypothetical protein
MFRIAFHLSYQDQTCYDVFGHETVRQIETYSADPYTLNYIHSSFNHNGDSTAFERNILSRQGGAVIHSVHDNRQSYPYRWTPEVYALFVGEHYRMHADYLEHHARKVKQYGADYGDPAPMRPLPLPMYFDMDSKRYQVEPWFTEAVRVRAINSAILVVRMRAYDAIQGARVGDWVDTPKGQFRIAHDWGDSVQLSSSAGDHHGVYLSVGSASYSGGLDSPIPVDRLQPTRETRPGTVWFFSENEVRAHNGIYLQADFRVFRI